MDDALSGAPTYNQARSLQQELYQLLTVGGFNLKKWASNELSLMNDAPGEKTLQLDSHELAHGVLGLQRLLSPNYFQVAVTEQPPAINNSATGRRNHRRKSMGNYCNADQRARFRMNEYPGARFPRQTYRPKEQLK
ncbi:uncharacterized protein LOC117224509 [Megalopta genalis]|uniref:uncharacterized protein LOC117224509 n=1 Tax=Megalopta genalis TaxID=115081 RepID=UPI003FD0CE12